MVYCYIVYRDYDLRKVINVLVQILFSEETMIKMSWKTE